MAVTDATAALIRDLDDPDKFIRSDRVSVFRPHTRVLPAVKLKDGTEVPEKTIQVTPDTLREIAENVNRAYRTDGQLVKLVIGHRKQAADAPETTQPPVAGYSKDFRAEYVDRPDGPVLRLTHAEYIRRGTPYEAKILAGEWPERSPEYDPADKSISGVAMLTRDQYLKLGTVSYQADGGRVVYALGGEMSASYKRACAYMRKIPHFAKYMDEPKDKSADDEPEDREGFASYLKTAHPRLAKYMDEMGVAGSAMGAQNATPPAPAAGEPATGYAKDGTPVNYAAAFAEINAKLAAEQAARAEERKARIKAECKAMLDPLTDCRGFDYARELGFLVNYQTDAERMAHIKNIVEHGRVLPSGRPIPIYQGVVDSAGAAASTDPAKPPPNFQTVLKYVKDHPGVDYDAAERILAAGK